VASIQGSYGQRSNEGSSPVTAKQLYMVHFLLPADPAFPFSAAIFTLWFIDFFSAVSGSTYPFVQGGTAVPGGVEDASWAD